MNKFWLIAQNEYRRNVFKKSFILMLLSVPLMVALNIGFGFIMESVGDNNAPVGYIDRAGVFANLIPTPLSGSEEPIEFISFQAVDQAQAALDANSIQAYYVLDTNYHETRFIELVYKKEPGDNARQQFYDFLQINLVSGQSAKIAYRAAQGTYVTVRAWNGKRQVPAGGPSFGLLLPLFVSLIFLALILMSSGYLMGAVAEEKENRTMEILVTSVSPMQLIGGKIIGIVAIGVTLLITWTIVLALGIFTASQMGIEWFQNVDINWEVVLTSLLIAIPAYILVASLMTAIGAMVTTTQEGQSVSSIFIILHLIPLYVSIAFISAPNSPLAVALSLLPFTALMTTAMRNLFTSVPAWQAAASAGIQTLSALGGLWLASRAFRLGLLRYGQRLSWRKLFRARQ